MKIVTGRACIYENCDRLGVVVCVKIDGNVKKMTEERQKNDKRTAKERHRLAYIVIF